MSDRSIMFIVALFIVIAAVAADHPKKPKVTCTAEEITVITADSSTYRYLTYLDISSNKPRVMNMTETGGVVQIPIASIKQNGTVHSFEFQLIEADLSEANNTVLTSKKSFFVECNHLVSGKTVNVSEAQIYEQVEISQDTNPANMTINSPMEIGETSSITIEMDTYQCGAIVSCHAQSETKDESNSNEMYQIYTHCAAESKAVLISKEKFDIEKKLLTADLMGIGMPDSKKVKITCKVAGGTSQDDCSMMLKTYGACP